MVLLTLIETLKKLEKQLKRPRNWTDLDGNRRILTDFSVQLTDSDGFSLKSDGNWRKLTDFDGNAQKAWKLMENRWKPSRNWTDLDGNRRKSTEFNVQLTDSDGFPLKSDGKWRKSTDFDGNAQKTRKSMKIDENRRNPSRILTEMDGNRRISMHNRRIPTDSDGKVTESDGNRRILTKMLKKLEKRSKTIKIDGIRHGSWRKWTDFDGFRCTIDGFRRILTEKWRKSTDFDGNAQKTRKTIKIDQNRRNPSRISTDLDGFRRIPTDFDGSSSFLYTCYPLMMLTVNVGAKVTMSVIGIV
jgi:hypothetical protein